jgi:hypothetical protein
VHLLGDAEVLSDLEVVVVVNVFASYFTDKKGKRKAKSDTVHGCFSWSLASLSFLFLLSCVINENLCVMHRTHDRDHHARSWASVPCGATIVYHLYVTWMVETLEVLTLAIQRFIFLFYLLLVQTASSSSQTIH